MQFSLSGQGLAPHMETQTRSSSGRSSLDPAGAREGIPEAAGPEIEATVDSAVTDALEAPAVDVDAVGDEIDGAPASRRRSRITAYSTYYLPLDLITLWGLI